MNTQSMKKFKWFWAWNDDKEEAWLTEMAHSGWHLQSVTGPGFYTFVSGEPRQDVYRLDFIANRTDYQNYLQLFKDAGWQHMGEMGGWQYFRKTAQEGEEPEIYTDNDSKAAKYQRLLIFLVIFLPILTTLFTRPTPADSQLYDFYNIMKLLGAFLMLLYVTAMVKIFQRILQLKKS